MNAQKIYNIDESGLEVNNNPGKVVANKVIKTVKWIKSAEEDKTI